MHGVRVWQAYITWAQPCSRLNPHTRKQKIPGFLQIPATSYVLVLDSSLEILNDDQDTRCHSNVLRKLSLPVQSPNICICSDISNMQ